MPIIGILGSAGMQPTAPTIGTATAGDTSATVAYTVPSYTGKGSGTVTYIATSSPGNFTGTGASPITVTGLTNGTSYTFTVRATTSYGVASKPSAASNSITPAVTGFNVAYLVAAGGAGGASDAGGGGGAGGVRTSASYPVLYGTSYTVTVGAGGSGGASGASNNGVNGVNCLWCDLCIGWW